MGWVRQSFCTAASVGTTISLVGLGIGSSVLALRGSSVALGVTIGIVACLMHDPLRNAIHELKYSSRDRLMAQESISMAMDERGNDN